MTDKQLTLFQGGAPAIKSSVFGSVAGYDGKMSAGVGAGFARITYKGGKWGLKYQGETKPFRRYVENPQTKQLMDDGPNPFLDVVILDVADHVSKYWYEGTYQEGDLAPPDCFSSNGLTPDPASPKRQCTTCAGCPQNAWGSKKSTDPGVTSKGKACADHKKLAVVPVADILNKAYGGPMLLQVPPSSLKMLPAYEQQLGAHSLRFFEVWTRFSFDPTKAYPEFVADAIASLSDQQAAQVIEMMEDPLIDRILNTEIEGVTDTALQTTGVVAGTPSPTPSVVPPTPAAMPLPNVIPMAGPVATPTPPPATMAPPPPPVRQAAPPPPPPAPVVTYQISPDGLYRWREGMANWELIPVNPAVPTPPAAATLTGTVIAPTPAAAAQATPAGRQRRSRTRAVAPENAAGGAPAPQQEATPTGPTPGSPATAPTAAPMPPTNGAAVDPDAAAKIGSMISDLL